MNAAAQKISTIKEYEKASAAESSSPQELKTLDDLKGAVAENLGTVITKIDVHFNGAVKDTYAVSSAVHAVLAQEPGGDNAYHKLHGAERQDLYNHTKHLIHNTLER